jgi:hypothetical protein
MKSKKRVWRKRVSILALSSPFGQVGYNRGEWQCWLKIPAIGQS